jgi:hypothetical protein
VIGTVAELTEAESEYGTFPVLMIDTGDKLVRVACARTKPRNEVLGRDIRKGDVVGIQYLGEGKTRNGGKFHDYRIHHEAAEPNAEPNAEPPRIPSMLDEPPVDGVDEPF